MGAISNVHQSVRARIIEKRTYLRPLDEDGDKFESPAEARDRVLQHQRWLWEQQLGRPLDMIEQDELAELGELIVQCRVSPSGRVKWMGGTALVRERASGAFNCSGTVAAIPADMTDIFWLLLQGCGVGAKAKPGVMTGLPASINKIEVVPSVRIGKGGVDETTSVVDLNKSTWTLKFGDSAKGWARGIGILLAEKPRVKTLILDLSELRPGGKRLKGYGWLSSGWEPLKDGLKIVTDVMQARGDETLTAIDINDIVNALGTVLSSRRSAQILLMDEDHPEIDDFVNCKVDRWEKGKGHREQSNNSIIFWKKPAREKIVYLLKLILETGDPGFLNGAEARRRAPEMETFNPCGEIILPSKGFCNLMQVVWHRFNGDFEGLKRAQWLAGRANYRQTCVSMRDGVLQLEWNDNQKLLRLCGVSPTGYVSWEFMNSPEHLEALKKAAVDGANAMADELGLQRPRRVTQVQPSGTVSKVMGLEGDECHEGAHVAMSRFIFNNINFSIFDPIVEKLKAANYHVIANPVDPTGMLVRFPVAYPASPLFTKVEKNGEVLELNQESALSQLERYRILMKHYVQHNCSITISFDESEIEGMADWFMENWDSYVGVSFLKRNDPTRTAEELGFKYLPQECVSQARYEEYAKRLLPVDLSDDKGEDLIDSGDCSTGACPIR